MMIWNEFKTVLLPWLIAAAVIALLEWRHGVEAVRWEGLAAAQAKAAERQGAALEKINGLLAAQGYTLPPFRGAPSP